ncbi:hypothetical protein MSBRW_0780 [Methanosarcina barkeri str. Wiesmoor]|uniref:DUF1616 domain-containing protein n=2 Tax=Methanosarcina barkeri TaxID=2208 RepID=A0A0E3QHC4_METBA|nr:hypothetical protein [Methanosarcina barkeri]AKB50033.1 hypothetical protein MSBRW_0780 [Methanosarcina barkeri str. Wiesmoor]
MDITPTLDEITRCINYFLTFPIPEKLYLFLGIWYPYLITFLLIAIVFYFIKRSLTFRYYIDGDYIILKIVFVFLLASVVFVPLCGMNLLMPNIPWAIIFTFGFLLLTIFLIIFSFFYHGIIPDYFHLSEDKPLFIHDIFIPIAKVTSLLFVFCLILSGVLAITSYDGTLKIGHISYDTDSEYKIGHLVDIPVKMGGPDTGLLITLSSEKPGTLKGISSLNLSSSDSNNQINNTLKSNGCLTGKAIDAGEYKIDINTTSLDPGYYNLRLENAKYKQINSVKTFYLSK